MAWIDFGALMGEVMIEMVCARSQLTPEESKDGELAGYRYQGAAARAIRVAFDKAEAAGAPPRQVCPHCGVVMGVDARFCWRCGRPRIPEAMPDRLEDLIATTVAKEAGLSSTEHTERQGAQETRVDLVERLWPTRKTPTPP